MPELISFPLNSFLVLIVAKLIVVSFFLIAGLFGVFNFSAVVDEMKAASLPAPAALAALMIVTQLSGSILLVTNLQDLAWLGAGMLMVFTWLCIPCGHPFWKYPEPRRTKEFQIALEHIALTGGLLLAAIASYN